MKSITFLMLVCGLLVNAQKPIVVETMTKEVNIYRNSAEIKSEAEVVIPKGSSEVILTNVSDVLEDESIQLEMSVTDGISILSTEYTENYISDYKIDNNKNLEVVDSIEIINKLLNQKNIEIEVNKKTIQLLDKNQTVLVGSNTSSVEQLTKLMDYYQRKSIELKNEQQKLTLENHKLSKILSRLNNSLKIKVSKQEILSDGMLVLKINNSKSNKKVSIKVSYLSYEASWEPFYEIKSNGISNPLDILLKAIVQQDTGLDWKNVRLTLVNGDSSRNNQIPTINPWFLNAFNTEDRNTRKKDRNYDSVANNASLEEVVVVGYVTNENQLNTTYEVDIPYSILSNGENHLINISKTEIPVDYKYYTVPALNKEAFLVANIDNFNQYNLISTKASMIFENTYVGETFLNTNSTTEDLKVTIGNDPRIGVTKQIIKDKTGEKFLSSYKEKTFTYDLVVKNNKNKSIKIEIQDQIPISKNDNVKVEILQSSKAKLDTEKGILTWNLKINPSETKKLRVSYKVRFPKDYTINNL